MVHYGWEEKCNTKSIIDLGQEIFPWCVIKSRVVGAKLVSSRDCTLRDLLLIRVYKLCTGHFGSGYK